MGFASLYPSYGLRAKTNFARIINMFAAFKPRYENNSLFRK